MALKRKWVLMTILIVSLSFAVALALTRPYNEGNANSSSASSNPSSNPGDKGGGVGNGILFVYVDASRNTEAPKNQSGIYFVIYNRLYYFRISGIKEYNVGQNISIWANYQDINYLIGNFTVGPGGTIDFEWKIPTLPYRTEIKYKYGLRLTGPNPSWHFAKRTTHGVGITLVIPQVPLGVLGATSAFTAAYCIKALTGKRRFPPK